MYYFYTITIFLDLPHQKKNRLLERDIFDSFMVRFIIQIHISHSPHVSFEFLKNMTYRIYRFAAN